MCIETIEFREKRKIDKSRRPGLLATLTLVLVYNYLNHWLEKNILRIILAMAYRSLTYSET